LKQWETVALGKIAESVTYGVTASATNEPGGPKFLRITDIQNGSVRWDQVPWCECDVRTAARARLAPGDIVFARTGATTGKSFLIRGCPKDAVFASYLIRVRLQSSVEPRYVTHFFQTADYWAQIAKSARGVAQPGVNAMTLKALQVPLPPLSEQRRIAEVLDRAEALRAKRRAALATLDTLTQAIFLEMFGDLAVNPKGWHTRPLQEVVRRGTIVTYGIVQAGDEFPGGVPYVRTGDIVDGEIVQRGLRRTHPDVAARFRRSRVEVGDIVMSIRATVGTTALVSSELDGANLTQGTARISPGEETDSSYLLHFLRSPGAQHWISMQIKGATFREITLGRLREMPVAVPPISLQHEFACRVAAVERVKAAQRASLAKLDALFASLQHRAFRGEL
jgi:type I restriction enzyme S subunit